MLPTVEDAPVGKIRSPLAPILSRTALLGVSFVSVLLAMLLLIGFIIWQAENAQDRVRQSIDARTAAEALVSAIRDAELQQRNLIISDDPDYRARLDLALARIPVQLSRLLAESDEVTQKDRLRELGELVGRRIAEVQDVIEALDRMGETAALDTMNGNGRRATMANIVDLLRDFDAEEDRIQTDRETWETQVRMWLAPALVAALAAACGLGWTWVRQERALSTMLGDVNRTLEAQVRERTAELENERRRVEALLADMTHRIGNSLAMVSSFLSLEARRSDNEKVSEALEEANRRVAAIASAQRRLRIATDRDEVALDKYLCDLAQDLRTTMFGQKVSFRIAAAPTIVNSHDAVAVGIILNELVTNALKHAFPRGREGLIKVNLSREDEKVVLCVTDDGIGVDESTIAGEHSLGFLVIKSMVASIHGELRRRYLDAGAAMPGTEWRLSFDG